MLHEPSSRCWARRVIIVSGRVTSHHADVTDVSSESLSRFQRLRFAGQFRDDRNNWT